MSIILETIKELEKKYKNSPSYLAKDDVIQLINKKPSFFGSGVTMWNCTDLFLESIPTFLEEKIN